MDDTFNQKLKRINPFIKYMTNHYYLKVKCLGITWDEIYSELLYASYQACEVYIEGRATLISFCRIFIHNSFCNMLAKSKARKNQRPLCIHDPEINDNLAITDSSLASVVELELLQLAKSDLSDEEIKLLELRFEKDLPYRDIGKLLNISGQGCQYRVVKLLKRLRAKLENCDAD